MAASPLPIYDLYAQYTPVKSMLSVANRETQNGHRNISNCAIKLKNWNTKGKRRNNVVLHIPEWAISILGYIISIIVICVVFRRKVACETIQRQGGKENITLQYFAPCKWWILRFPNQKGIKAITAGRNSSVSQESEHM